MNTALMLMIAEEIETHPERYNQACGSYLSTNEHCPACVAVTALRLRKQDFMGRGWGRVSSDATEQLELSSQQATALFGTSPDPLELQKQFPGVTTAELDEIGELANWTASGGRLRHVTVREEAGPVSFNFFWTGKLGTEEVPGWRRSSAHVMAATLRLIARGDVPADAGLTHRSS